MLRKLDNFAEFDDPGLLSGSAFGLISLCINFTDRLNRIESATRSIELCNRRSCWDGRSIGSTRFTPGDTESISLEDRRQRKLELVKFTTIGREFIFF